MLKLNTGQNRMKLSLAPKKNGAFPSFIPPLKAKVPFLQGFFLISPGFGPNSEFWCRVFPNFTKNSIISWKCSSIQMVFKIQYLLHIRSKNFQITFP